MKVIYGVIYQTFNNINGKTYIGQTTRTGKYLKRYVGSGRKLRLAIKKYGKENFEKEILCECSSREQLDRMERLYIALYNPDYNIDRGGNSSGRMSQETKDKIGNFHRNKIVSEETRRKNSEAHKGKTRQDISESNRTRVITEETRQKMSHNKKIYWNNKRNIS